MLENFETETIKMPHGDEVSYSPARGGMITSLKFSGREILYFDQETFRDINLSVRGGIPILFPNAGFIESSKFPNLKQHGFARNMPWQSEKVGHGFTEILTSNDETKKIFPYDFKLSLHGEFKENGSFSIIQSVENTGQEIMPVSMGLHPYFKVPHEAKKDIKFNFDGGEIIERDVENWGNNSGTVYVDNPKVVNPIAVMKVFIPSLGTLFIDASVEYKKVAVWSLPEKDFICIEPIMRLPGGLVGDPELVMPGKVLTAKVNISLK